MKLFRLCIALFGMLAFFGSSQACVILGQHLSEIGNVEKCGSHPEEDDACDGCTMQANLQAEDVRLETPTWQLCPQQLVASWIEGLRQLRSGQGADPEVHPPPDPSFACRVRLTATRALPVRGPNARA